MFTGIVEEQGSILQMDGNGEAMRIRIAAKQVLSGVKLGDSIAVNGVCLTVTTFADTWFTADVMPETMKKTNLGRLAKGHKVNLERAMALGDRFGGHIVSGHVDGTGTMLSRESHANAVVFRFSIPTALCKYMIPRGSIAVDGISLTVVDVWKDGFSVSIIPHTLAQTSLGERKVGDVVNLECDVLGKYVESLLLHRTADADQLQRSTVDLDFLREHGFA